MLLKKKNPELREGERLDDLIIGGLKIIQHEKRFCFSIDAVLLAHFATLKARVRAADLGTGTGVLSLLLAARGAVRLEAIEINPDMADMAQRSVAVNSLEEKIIVHTMDYRDIRANFPAEVMDLVVANPPYRPVGNGKQSEIDDIAMARHEVTATLGDVVAAARYLLKYRGRFAMVHLPERLSEIMVAMHAAGIEPKRLQYVQSRTDKRPMMVLIEGVCGAQPGIVTEPPLVLYREDGTYTDAVLRYYREA